MKVKVFRHHLICLLLLFDFGKAVVLLWYPARVLLVPSAYNNVNFCEVVGFFTSSFIEGADIAVLVLAIHTALLIFKKYTGTEGGLYKYRNYVYGINFFLPLIAASLAFIDKGRHSYKPLITWCYLPVRPLWYRLVLSWVPRYIVLGSILVIYLSIYFYVKFEYRKVVNAYKQSQSYITKTNDNSNLSLFARFKNMFKTSTTRDNASHKTHFSAKRCAIRVASRMCQFLSNFPGLSFLEPQNLFHENKSNPQNMEMAIQGFQKDAMANFQARRSMIERQIRTIFLYPIAYLLLWIAPFATHILQYRTDAKHSTVYWISCIAAFMQPFNCTVDTLVFCIRERPWLDHEEVIFTRKNAEIIKSWLSHLVPCVSNKHTEQESSQTGNDSNPQDDTFDNNKTDKHIYDTSPPDEFASFEADIERYAAIKKQNADNHGVNESTARPSRLDSSSHMVSVLSSQTNYSSDPWAHSRPIPTASTHQQTWGVSITPTTLHEQDDMFPMFH